MKDRQGLINQMIAHLVYSDIYGDWMQLRATMTSIDNLCEKHVISKTFIVIEASKIIDSIKHDQSVKKVPICLMKAKNCDFQFRSGTFYDKDHHKLVYETVYKSPTLRRLYMNLSELGVDCEY